MVKRRSKRVRRVSKRTMNRKFAGRTRRRRRTRKNKVRRTQRAGAATLAPVARRRGPASIEPSALDRVLSSARNVVDGVRLAALTTRNREEAEGGKAPGPPIA